MTKKKSIKGGKRVGAGRPATGKNTITVSFSVHKDFKDPLMAKVKETIDALKKEREGRKSSEKTSSAKSTGKSKIPPMPVKEKGESAIDFAARKNIWKKKYGQLAS